MASVTWVNVLDIASELSGVPVALQTVILSFVNTKVNTEPFGGEADPTTYLVRINLAAHFGAMIPAMGGAAGPVIAESEGELSVQYGQVNMSSNFSLTAYGQVFSTLARMFAGGAYLC